MVMEPNSRTKRGQGEESGYVLLLLLLGMALLIIAAAVAAPTISFDIKRDREEEMIHRGVQYSRAIRAYYKKFGRYPVKLEDLESTNNMRFLRKRYKDPITGQDFKLLHFGDVKLAFSGGMMGGSIPGAGPMNGAPGMNATTGNLGQTPAFGAGNSGFGINQAPGGQNPQSAGNSGATDSTGSNPPSTNADGQSDTSNSQQSSGDQLSKTTFGGGPIVGVVSSSKQETIREFNHKKKYSEWQFIYDPGTDRGGLLMTPNQPPLMGIGQSNGSIAPQNNPTGGNPMPTGMQNNPISPVGDYNNQPQQPNNPPQQQ